MMKHLKFLLIIHLLAALGMLSACNDDPEIPNPNVGNVLIVNEGNFGTGNGTLSLYDREMGTITNRAFFTANGGRELASNIQSVYPLNAPSAALYIICNAADKIEVVDIVSLQALQAPIESDSLVTPRFMAATGDRGFVSIWGPYDANFNLNASKVFVFDLTDNSLVASIPVAAGPEGILAYDGKVYVANSFTNSVQVIDAQSLQITKTIETHVGPNRLLLDRNNRIWTIATGGFGGTPRLQGIDPNTDEIVADISLDGTGANGKFVINAEGNTLYFLGSEPFPSTATRVFEMDIFDTSAPTAPLIEGNNFYGIGSDFRTGNLYIGESNSFQGEGSVLRFDEQAMPLDTIPVGVGPNSFLFY